MFAKCVVVWIATSVILASANTTTTMVPSKSRNVPRIYVPGGRPVEPKEFPFLVLLEIKTGEEKKAHCSGSITSKTTVLSAAHCDNGPITAYAGMVNISDDYNHDNIQKREVGSLAKPVYPIIHDIMICKLKKAWEWNDYVKPVALHLSAKSLQPSFVISCQVMGFGETGPESESGAAHVMDQLIGSSSQCVDLHPFMWFCSFFMCSINVRNKTLCEADSGGPVICSRGSSNQQWAINMGISPAGDTECLPTKTANMYVTTSYFRRWILRNIKDLPSRADSIHRRSVKISMYKALLHQPLWLLLSVAVQLLYLF